MTEKVSAHYSGGGDLADRIADGLRKNGMDPADLRASGLEAVDEFHFRGRAATLELLVQMNLTADSKVLDIGSGLGGVARTIADGNRPDYCGAQHLQSSVTDSRRVCG